MTTHQPDLTRNYYGDARTQSGRVFVRCYECGGLTWDPRNETCVNCGELT